MVWVYLNVIGSLTVYLYDPDNYGFHTDNSIFLYLFYMLPHTYPGMLRMFLNDNNDKIRFSVFKNYGMDANIGGFRCSITVSCLPFPLSHSKMLEMHKNDIVRIIIYMWDSEIHKSVFENYVFDANIGSFLNYFYISPLSSRIEVIDRKL